MPTRRLPATLLQLLLVVHLLMLLANIFRLDALAAKAAGSFVLPDVFSVDQAPAPEGLGDARNGQGQLSNPVFTPQPIDDGGRRVARPFPVKVEPARLDEEPKVGLQNSWNDEQVKAESVAVGEQRGERGVYRARLNLGAERLDQAGSLSRRLGAVATRLAHRRDIRDDAGTKSFGLHGPMLGLQMPLTPTRPRVPPNFS